MVILAIGKANYCKRASILVTSNVLLTINCLFDMDLQANLVAKSFSPALCMKEVRNQHYLDICSTMNGPIIIFKHSFIFKRCSQLNAKAKFSVVENCR